MAALSAQSIVKLLFTRGGLALLIVALAALALLLAAVRAGPTSEAHGGTVLGIDMDAFNGATEDGAGPAFRARLRWIPDLGLGNLPRGNAPETLHLPEDTP